MLSLADLAGEAVAGPVATLAALVVAFLLHRSAITSRLWSRARVKTAELVSVLSRKLDTQKRMLSAWGL